MRFVTILMAVGLATALPALCLATTWEVPGDAATIQGAIDLASPGDIVLVHPGTYTGVGNKDLNFGGKDLVLRSQSGPEVTIIDCEGSGRGFTFGNGESPAAVVEGFTVLDGHDINGGGMYIDNSSPTVNNCVFSGGGGTSGGLLCSNSSSTISNCVVCGISGAWSGGMSFAGTSSCVVSNCTIVDNLGAYGSGITLSNSADITVSNSIIAFGNGSAAVSYHALFGGGSATLSCCDVYGNEGGDWVDAIAGQNGINGNISEDPLFCGEASNPNDPYSLDVSSPCAVRNSPCGQLIGARPAGCTEEIHAETTSWGMIRALFR